MNDGMKKTDEALFAAAASGIDPKNLSKFEKQYQSARKNAEKAATAYEDAQAAAKAARKSRQRAESALQHAASTLMLARMLAESAFADETNDGSDAL